MTLQDHRPAQRRLAPALIRASAWTRRFWGLLLAWSVLIAVTASGNMTAARMPADGLQSGQFVWMPQLSPSGPLVVVISVPVQRAYVYRNGVRIGISTVSTGRSGYETPGGVFTILQKHREHYSNRYDNAPMPFMQRLSWDGLALHAGGLPGYPASHGCVRLPAPFAELLFRLTTPGTVVVIATEETFPPTVTSPGVFAPVDATSGTVLHENATDNLSFEWFPERSPGGALTILLSTSDQRLVVLRNGVEIGRANILVRGASLAGTQAYVLLEGKLPEPSLVVPDRPALRWMMLTLPGIAQPPEDLRQAIAAGDLSLPTDFARLLYDALLPGATVVVTDEPLQPAATNVTVMASDPNEEPENGPELP